METCGTHGVGDGAGEYPSFGDRIRGALRLLRYAMSVRSGPMPGRINLLGPARSLETPDAGLKPRTRRTFHARKSYSHPGGTGGRSIHHRGFDSLMIVSILTTVVACLGAKMAQNKNKKKGFTTREICKRFEISKATLFRWEKEGRITDVWRDWRNWRLYSEQNVQEIRKAMTASRSAGRR